MTAPLYGISSEDVKIRIVINLVYAVHGGQNLSKKHPSLCLEVSEPGVKLC